MRARPLLRNARHRTMITPVNPARLRLIHISPSYQTAYRSFEIILEWVLLRSEIPSGMRAKLRSVAASNNRDHARNLSSRTLVIKLNRSHVNIGRATTSQSLLLLLARATRMMVLFFTHVPFVVNHTINATPPEIATKSPPFCNEPHRSHVLCVKAEPRAACAQSFAPWQQATMEIMLAISLRVR